MNASSEPSIIPVFPLTGSLLLPGNFLPLNVFERRYRNLVADALDGDRRMGMIQPRIPAADNWGPGEGRPEDPDLYAVGCLGRIDQYDPQPDGRYLVLLRGVRRFRVVRELPPVKGYRRVEASFAGYDHDLDESEEGIDREALLDSALAFARQLELDFDPDLLRALESTRLLNVLSAALPFAPAEKQALLEAVTAPERQSVLMALMRMAPGEQALHESLGDRAGLRSGCRTVVEDAGLFGASG